jgi:predicted kinase
LLECARECLRAGINAIVDAAFLKAHERQAFAALANSEGAGFLILSCTADTATLAARIEQRRASRNDPSDADEQVMRRQIQTMESIATEELPHVLEMDTRDPNALQRTLERIRQVTAAAAPRG